MHRSRSGSLVTLFAVSYLICACGTDTDTAGSVDIALTGESESGHVYRLRDAEIRVEGEGIVELFRTEDDPARASIDTRLAPGAYTLSVADGWRLERLAAGGAAVTVNADLVSSNPHGFVIASGARSRVTLRFRADGDDVALGDGDLSVDIGVDDIDAGAVDAPVDAPIDAVVAVDAAVDAAPGAPADAAPDAGPVAGVIHVATTGSDSASGDAQHPVQRVAAAIVRAAACQPRCSVRIAGGSYDESIVMVSGVSLYGGYSPDFSTRNLQFYPTRLRSPQGTTVLADRIQQATAIDGLILRAADAAAGSGAASHGLWVRDSTSLQLQTVRVEGGQGGHSADAGDGALTVCGAAGGSGGEAFVCGSRAGTAASAGGDPTSAGGGGDGGASVCTATCSSLPIIDSGRTGVHGGTGVAGAPGAAPVDDDGFFVADAWVGAVGAPGERGRHGTGGGGGGSGGSLSCGTCQGLLGGRGGDGAPGGCGGGGGAAAVSGGASMAVVVLRSTVTAAAVEVVAGKGGNGGRGGNGHPGGPATFTSNQGRTQGQVCTSSFPFPYSAGSGGNGGNGGGGGSGGAGPGGAGGPSIGIALVGGSQLVSAPGAVTVQAGQPGLGGAGGTSTGAGPRGPDGRAATVVTY